MTRPFSVVRPFEVALAISCLLSSGLWGEPRSILRAPDRTRGQVVPCLRGFSRERHSPLRQSSRKLQIGAAVELAQAVEAELGDSGGWQLACRVADLSLNTISNEGEAAGVDVAFMAGPGEAAKQLLTIERLPGPVPLDHRELLRYG